MNALSSILMLSIAAAFGASVPMEAQAQVAAQAQAQTPTLTPAQARAARTRAVRAAAQARAAAQVRAVTPGAAPSVGGVTVQPQATPQGRVVSSTDATSLTSPNYSAKDAQPAPRAFSLGGNAAAGVQPADNAPVPGLPASQAGGARHSDIGVTTVF
jgi:hypothetical protein